MNKWFKMQAEKGSVEIDIFGEIGYELTFKDFKNELDTFKNYDEINVQINSIGGAVFEGFAIYNLLKSNKAKVNVTITGIAASIASIIAMAGDTISMYDNSYLMIHLPSCFSYGDEKDHEKTAELLKRIKNDSVKIYQTKFKKTEAEIVEMLENETWFSASELKDLGIVNEILEGLEIAAKFDLKDFSNTPEQVKNLFEAEKKDEGKGKAKKAKAKNTAETEIKEILNDVNTDKVVNDVKDDVKDEAVNDVKDENIKDEKDENKADVKDTDEKVTDEIKDEKTNVKDTDVKDTDVKDEKAVDNVLQQADKVIEMKTELDSFKAKYDKAVLDMKALTEKVSMLTSAKDKAENDSIEMKARLEKLLSPALKKSEDEVQSWKEAMAKCDGDYVKARKEYNAVWKAYVDNANK